MGWNINILHNQIGHFILVVRRVMKNCVMLAPSTKTNNEVCRWSFNMHTAAKDNQFEAGMIFGSKKDFKQDERSTNMANSRPYQYLHNDLKKSKLGVHGCPHKMWLTYIKEKDMWQLKSILNKKNYVWNYKTS